MSTDIKLSEVQISKITQSGGFFGSQLADLGKLPATDLVIPLARDNSPILVRNVASNAINTFGHSRNRHSGRNIEQNRTAIWF